MLKKIIIPFLIILFAFNNAAAEDRRQNASSLTVMTLNTEFMWDGIAPEEGQVDFSWKNSPTEALEHMEDISKIIIRNNPDIVNLVEVENKNAVDILNNTYLANRGYQVYFKKGKDTYTGQDMALLTRIDPATMVYDDRKGSSGTIEKSVSKNYVAEFTINNTKIAVIGLHFLSRPDDASRLHPRQAQADAIRKMAVEKDAAGYEVIVLGDFNDYDGDSCCIDHVDSAPITSVLNDIKAMNGSSGNDDLENTAGQIQKSARYTAYWDADRDNNIDSPGEYTSIDHILVSPGLSGKIHFVQIDHTHDPRYVTDHFPVIVQFDFSGGSPTQDGVRIISLLANPEGNENQNEEITIKNFSSASVSLIGWTVKDIVNTTWKLDSLGTLNAGQEKTIKRNNQKMGMNNNGDTIDLINNTGQVVHTVNYTSTIEGDVIYFTQ